MKTYHYNCTCLSADHSIRFIVWDDDISPEMYLDVQLIQYRNVFQRIWAAIKYVCGYQCTYGHWDCWTLDNKDVDGLQLMLDEYKKLIKPTTPITNDINLTAPTI